MTFLKLTDGAWRRDLGLTKDKSTAPEMNYYDAKPCKFLIMSDENNNNGQSTNLTTTKLRPFRTHQCRMRK